MKQPGLDTEWIFLALWEEEPASPVPRFICGREMGMDINNTLVPNPHASHVIV